MKKYTDLPLYIPRGDDASRARVWAGSAADGTAVVIATFKVSKIMRDEEIKANARRAVACWNFCQNLSTEQIESANKVGVRARVVPSKGTVMYRRPYQCEPELMTIEDAVDLGYRP